MYPYLICASPLGLSKINSPTGGTTAFPEENETKPS